MVRISLIIPFGSQSAPADVDIESLRHALSEQVGVSSVEVILAGEDADLQHAIEAGSITTIPMTDKGRVDCLRAGIRAATGDLLVILDPSRSYPAEALGEIVQGLRRSDADLAIAVRARARGRSFWRSSLGFVSQTVLGSADVSSGLMAIRRSPTTALPRDHSSRGSRLALDVLACPHESRVDVPVSMHVDDRVRLGSLGVNDIRQLKRVLDYRFGTFSRLVQFCMVGASGMVVDLTLYALFQLVFARFWPIPSGLSASGFSWPLAAAGSISILVALGWNFTLNRRLTFNDARRGSILRQFLTYALGNALGIAVSLFLRLYLPLHVGFFAHHRLAAAVVGILVATGISFSMSRWVVFIRRPDSRSTAQQAHLAVDSALR
jgi:dolichol-phosphate mannosyltransferase